MDQVVTERLAGFIAGSEYAAIPDDIFAGSDRALVEQCWQLRGLSNAGDRARVTRRGDDVTRLPVGS